MASLHLFNSAAAMAPVDELSEQGTNEAASRQGQGQHVCPVHARPTRWARVIIPEASRSKGGTPIDLNRMVMECRGRLQGESSHGEVELSLESTEGLPLIKGDGPQLQQVVLNLMQHSLDRVRDSSCCSPKVMVRTRRCGLCQVLLSVRDAGPAMSEERLEYLLRMAEHDGDATALQISRSIVERHEGRIWGEMHAEGGMTLHVLLPGFSSCRACSA